VIGLVRNDDVDVKNIQVVRSMNRGATIRRCVNRGTRLKMIRSTSYTSCVELTRVLYAEPCLRARVNEYLLIDLVSVNICGGGEEPLLG
jgi:hypothetical protein